MKTKWNWQHKRLAEAAAKRWRERESETSLEAFICSACVLTCTYTHTHIHTGIFMNTQCTLVCVFCSLLFAACFGASCCSLFALGAKMSGTAQFNCVSYACDSLSLSVCVCVRAFKWLSLCLHVRRRSRSHVCSKLWQQNNNYRREQKKRRTQIRKYRRLCKA